VHEIAFSGEIFCDINMDTTAQKLPFSGLTNSKVIAIYKSLIDQLKRIHDSGGYVGNLSITTVEYDSETNNITILSNGSINGDNNLNYLQRKDIYDLGYLMHSLVFNVNKDGEGKKLSPVMPSWLSITIKRMLNNDYDFSITDLSHIVDHNIELADKANNHGSFSSGRLTTNLTHTYDRKKSRRTSIHSDEARSRVFRLLVLHLCITLLSLTSLLSKVEVVSLVGALVLFFQILAMIGMLPTLPFNSRDNDPGRGIRIWLRGSFYLTIWMIVFFLANVIYLDIEETRDKVTSRGSISSANWIGAGIISVESAVHGVTLAPISPTLKSSHDVVSGGVTHDSQGRPLFVIYGLFVVGFILLVSSYIGRRFSLNDFQEYFLWIAGLLLIELLALLLIESSFASIPNILHVEYHTLGLRFRTVSLAFGLLNSVLFYQLSNRTRQDI
jgi:hypothetical protein